jgi:hypothetical protein
MQEEKEALSSLTLIKDPLIEPYFIGKDSSSYTIYESLKIGNNNKGRGRKTRTKEGIKSVSFHTTFGACLSAIAKLKIDNRPVYNSISEYVTEWKRVKEEISQIVNPEL